MTGISPRTYISALQESRLAGDFPRTVTILGSTGSIGRNALRVVEQNMEHFQVVALAGARNVDMLARQAAVWRPSYLGVLEPEGAERLRSLLPLGYDPEIVVGQEGYVALATLPEVSLVLAAQVGAAGLRPSLAAAGAGKIVALANKESLVLAGELFRTVCASSGAVILPVDSEHNALFQTLMGHDIRHLRKLVLTASGGPFRGRSYQDLEHVTAHDALKHPNWSMGAKITIDSATLMNKGLEFIEAHMLYGIPPEDIQVVVHPQSIIHSLVEYHDGSLLAHLGMPDMRIPIAYCMAFPQRLPLPMEPLNLLRCGPLTFEEPDLAAFPCLDLAMQTLDPALGGQGQRVVLNAANEMAVAAFLEERIGFNQIPALLRTCLERYQTGDTAPPETVEDIVELDALARIMAQEATQALTK